MNNALDPHVEMMVDTIATFFSNYPNAHANQVELAAKLGGDERLARLILIRAGMRPHFEEKWVLGSATAPRSRDVLSDEGVFDELLADWAGGA